jgi:hypothetical protein
MRPLSIVTSGYILHSDSGPATDFLRYQPVPDPDFIVPVEIENRWHNMYVQKRPGVDEFLRQMGELYEVVVYTASLGSVSSLQVARCKIQLISCFVAFSMRIRCWTILTSTILFHTGSSGKVVSGIEKTMSRFVYFLQIRFRI